LKGKRYRCASCRYDWRPRRMPLRLTLQQRRALLRWFIRGLPSVRIAEETHLDRKRVLRALTAVRLAMAGTLPDEARRPEELSTQPQRPGAATLELYVADGRVWANVMPDADAERLGTLLREKKLDSAGLRCAAVVYRGRLHRVARSEGDGPPAPAGEIEGFWAYLQRQLRAKGGIRRARLNFYLAEYSWRYAYRKLSSAEQLRELLALVGRANQVATTGLSGLEKSSHSEGSLVPFESGGQSEPKGALTETVGPLQIP
jgi:hypothetical protein